MNNDKEIYSDDLKGLKEIAEQFKSEIDQTYRLVEEFYSSLQENKGIETQDLQKLVEMAIVYLMMNSQRRFFRNNYFIIKQ